MSSGNFESHLFANKSPHDTLGWHIEDKKTLLHCSLNGGGWQKFNYVNQSFCFEEEASNVILKSYNCCSSVQRILRQKARRRSSPSFFCPWCIVAAASTTPLQGSDYKAFFIYIWCDTFSSQSFFFVTLTDRGSISDCRTDPISYPVSLSLSLSLLHRLRTCQMIWWTCVFLQGWTHFWIKQDLHWRCVYNSI